MNPVAADTTSVPMPPVQEESPAPATNPRPGPAPDTAAVSASGCSCKSGAAPLVYAIGSVGFDYGSEARLDSVVQGGLREPHNPQALIAHLKSHPSDATAINWTLLQESTPTYAIRPDGVYGAEGYQRIIAFLSEQLAEGVERVSVPGVVSGSVRLMNGQVVPVIRPEVRGMYSWTTKELVKAVTKAAPERAKEAAVAEGVRAFLERVYHEFRNLGLAPQERAINFAATNAFQAEEVFHHASLSGLHMEGVQVERSPICRPGSDCWDVRITFFHPTKRMEHARHVYRFTVDVSDVVPVTVGRVRHWPTY